jgi:tRNA A37 threonylcarbamoyladenosine synthetase subunit TsaC/SUA5/YrdC
MSRFLRYAVHPDNPQPRLLRHASDVIVAGGVAALPTANGYLLACRLDDKAAGTRLRRLAGQTDRDPAVLLCRDLAQAAVYLRIDDHAFRAIRNVQPDAGPWLLPCTKRVPRRLLTAGAMARLCFAGEAATQGLLGHIDEALLLSPPAHGAASLDRLPPLWRDGIDLALDVGPLAPRRCGTAADDVTDESPTLAAA